VSITVLLNAGPWLPVPPAGYGGIETIVATLVPELRRLGVRVVLATVGPSTLPADDYLRPLSEPRFDRVAAPYNQVSGITHAHMHDVVAYLRDHPGIDVVHDHLEVVGPAVLGAMGPAAPPTLQTLHWDLTKHADFYERFDGRGRVAFAAVSQSQLDRAPKKLRDQTIGVVPLAVPPPPPSPETLPQARGRHVLVLARITRDKGQDISARVCRRAGVPLVLAGPVAGIGDPHELRQRLDQGDTALASHPDVRYFVEEVLPHVDGENVSWVGGVAGDDKERLLRSSRALLATIRWAEPGATGVVEALGRGIPVVGTPLGVLPSLVEHGVTGLLGRTEDELTALLSDLDSIDPDACRASVTAWTPRAMAERYLELYRTLIARQEAR
jgi:glycosyltransferase involved in cell wall biosynthesis